MVSGYVVHGSLGVCEVIGTEERLVGDENRKFVVIQAKDPQNSKSMIPVQNFETVTRDIVSQDKVHDLMEYMTTSECEYIKDYKKRTTDYLKLSTSNSIKDRVDLIVSLHNGFELSRQEKRPVSTNDRMLFEDQLQELTKEVSLAMNEKHDSVLEKLNSKLEKRKFES